MGEEDMGMGLNLHPPSVLTSPSLVRAHSVAFLNAFRKQIASRLTLAWAAARDLRSQVKLPVKFQPVWRPLGVQGVQGV